MGSSAFWWGILSAVSLPLGAWLGLTWRPGARINSAFMAFGAGALLFALTIELFAHVPHHVESHGVMALAAAIGGALLGGFLFDELNKMLNKKGAFVRSLSNAKKYVLVLKRRRAKKLAEELSSVRVLRELSPEQMALLVSRVKKKNFEKGCVIFRQDTPADDMLFILSGEVEILRHRSDGSTEMLATLGKDETFGEMGLLTDRARTADAVALTDVVAYSLERSDFQEFVQQSPKLQKALAELVQARLSDQNLREQTESDDAWKRETLERIEMGSFSLHRDEIQSESEGVCKKSGAGVAIWLGLLIDAIPESLVIGRLAVAPEGMSVAFIAGVFLANMPEAMSSSVTMKSSGLKSLRIALMWISLCLITGIGAFIGAQIFPQDPVGSTFYLALVIEGLAAGAMLTMIAETMLPEAFEQGGSIIGMATLLGFLAALSVKVM